MKTSVQAIAVSLLTMALGVAWLLNTLDIIPGVNWIWTLGLGLTGLFILGLGGLNKLTIVTGPFLIIASVFSIFRQTGRLNINHEVPILVIVFGALMLISQLAPLPMPGWDQSPKR